MVVVVAVVSGTAAGHNSSMSHRARLSNTTDETKLGESYELNCRLYIALGVSQSSRSVAQPCDNQDQYRKLCPNNDRSNL